jgi:hypothetical protein
MSAVNRFAFFDQVTPGKANLYIGATSLGENF